MIHTEITVGLFHLRVRRVFSGMKKKAELKNKMDLPSRHMR
jgi:hypothetical protein